MGIYEVLGEQVIVERRSTTYEASSAEEAVAMAQKELKDKTYYFSDWEYFNCSTNTEIKLKAFLR